VKNNVADIDNALALVEELRPVKYHYDTEIEELQLSSKLQYGLIAQELKEILPELITNHSSAQLERGASPEDLLGVNYNALIPILIKAVQEQAEVIQNQSSTISKLQKDMNAVMDEVVKINALLD